jgi:hypothetical protein
VQTAPERISVPYTVQGQMLPAVRMLDENLSNTKVRVFSIVLSFFYRSSS